MGSGHVLTEPQGLPVSAEAAETHGGTAVDHICWGWYRERTRSKHTSATSAVTGEGLMVPLSSQSASLQSTHSPQRACFVCG